MPFLPIVPFSQSDDRPTLYHRWWKQLIWLSSRLHRDTQQWDIMKAHMYNKRLQWATRTDRWWLPLFAYIEMSTASHNWCTLLNIASMQQFFLKRAIIARKFFTLLKSLSYECRSYVRSVLWWESSMVLGIPEEINCATRAKFLGYVGKFLLLLYDWCCLLISCLTTVVRLLQICCLNIKHFYWNIYKIIHLELQK